MIYVTGDVHGGIDINKLSSSNFPEGDRLTRQDYVIVCGDFGLPFLPTDVWDDDQFLPSKAARASRREYLHWIKWLSQRPYTLLWVDGNHDNHPYWQDQKTEFWNGGLINRHPEADNVLHLKRGEYYTIDGRTFWTMGGAASHDREWRTEGYSWWPQEIPSGEELAHGDRTLQEHGDQVDYIITHTMPQSLVMPLTGFWRADQLQNYFDEIYTRVRFKRWFCGHFHQEINSSGFRMRVLYNEIEGPLE